MQFSLSTPAEHPLKKCALAKRCERMKDVNCRCAQKRFSRAEYKRCLTDALNSPERETG
jgi:hypothetical protein